MQPQENIAAPPQNHVKRKLLLHIGALLSLTIVCVALWVLYKTLHEIELADVIDHFKALPITSILLAFCITITSYVVVTGYDVVALRHIERPLPYPRAALAAFLASAFGNNIGFALVTGGSIRYRIYTPVGLTGLEIAGIATMCSLTTSLGMTTIFAFSMLFGSGQIAQSAIHIPPDMWRVVGGGMLAVIVGYIVVTAIRPITIRTRNWSLKLPNATLTLAQILLASTNLMLIGTLIYVLLPAPTGTNYISFLGVFILALMAGSVSNVPGGIGVFETVLLVGLPDIEPAALIGSILIFRCIHFLTPLGLASILLAAHETSLQRDKLTSARETATDWLAEIGPQLMAMIIVFAGVVLLFSGAIPIEGKTRVLFEQHMPLAVLEMGHLLGSACGLGLIYLALGLTHRLVNAHRLTLMVLGLGIAASLLKGLAYREAVLLAVIFGVLFFTRPEFTRKAPLRDQGYPVEWSTTLTVILAVTIWLGLFAYKNFDYSLSLWWQFAYDGDYSRFLRATLMVLGLTGAATLMNLLRKEPVPDQPYSSGHGPIKQIIKYDPNPRANLALLGDKRLLLSDSGKSFLMYRVKGKNWIALCDPVGLREEREQLIWTFRELSDRYSGSPVFYLVDGDNLSLYVDLGLSILKLGEDARVPLETFSLSRSENAMLRATHDQLLSLGVNFEIVLSSGVPALIAEFKSVSDDWLAATGAQEKSFSRGFFNPDYIVNFPCAVARQHGQIIAFAVLWASADKQELAYDVTRHHREAPDGIMDYMAVELMQGGKSRGYQWFNLGLAPLTHLEARPLAPIWQRVSRLLYRQGEQFLDMEHIGDFNDRFHPQWRPKYLASRGGHRTPQILRDIASLIAGR